jgi:xylulose-5-phosphate/fructose-6-phosphate phosphoketolase
VRTNPEHLKVLEDWMRAYEPDRLFGTDGRISSELREALCPTGTRRMSANPIANGGILKKPLRILDFKNFAIDVPQAGVTKAGSMTNFARLLKEIVASNQTNFRLWGSDETESNKLGAVYEAGK